VPALLETEAHTRTSPPAAATSSRLPLGVAARRVEVTVLRQHTLDRESPPELLVVIDEPALHPPAGDAQVMQEHLDRLASGRPRPPCRSSSSCPAPGALREQRSFAAHSWHEIARQELLMYSGLQYPENSLHDYLIA
jgi:Domain of unknown function (DUF5753)